MSAAAALVGDRRQKKNPNHKGDEEDNYFMAVCFPANQLTIIDYNRVVKDLNGSTSVSFWRLFPATLEIEEKGENMYKPATFIIFLFIWTVSGGLSDSKTGYYDQSSSDRGTGCNYFFDFSTWMKY